MRGLLVTVGNLRVLVRAPEGMLAALLPRCRPYSVNGETPDLVLDVESSSSFRPHAPPRVLPPRPEVSCEGDHHLFWRHDFELKLARGVPAQAICRCLEQPRLVENALRLCLSHLLPVRGGLLVHASAVAREGKGFVFTGASGSGKSTAVRLLSQLHGIQPLGDEVVVLRLTQDGARVESTPFGGNEAMGPGDAPIRRLIFLSPRPGELESPAGRTARLLRNVLSFGGAPEVVSATMSVAESLVTEVECLELLRPSRAELDRATA